MEDKKKASRSVRLFFAVSVRPLVRYPLKRKFNQIVGVAIFNSCISVPPVRENCWSEARLKVLQVSVLIFVLK